MENKLHTIDVRLTPLGLTARLEKIQGPGGAPPTIDWRGGPDGTSHREAGSPRTRRASSTAERRATDGSADDSNE